MGLLSIMAGFPLSGKSTYCKELQNKGHVIGCPDTVRLATHGEQFIPIAEPTVWATTQVMVRALLKDGHNVVVDATNTTKERRKMWLCMAKEFGIPLHCHWIKTSSNECHIRNNKLQKLDRSIIDRMVSQFEEPTEDEGLIMADTSKILNATWISNDVLSSSSMELSLMLTYDNMLQSEPSSIIFGPKEKVIRLAEEYIFVGGFKIEKANKLSIDTLMPEGIVVANVQAIMSSTVNAISIKTDKRSVNVEF